MSTVNFFLKQLEKNSLPTRIKAPTDFLKIIFLRSSYRTCSWNPWRQKSFDLTSSFLRQHLRSFGRNSFNHSSHFKKNSPLRSSLFLAIWRCSSFHIAFVFRWCSGLLLVLCPGLRDHLWCWWSNLGSVICKVSALSTILPDTVNFYAIPFLPLSPPWFWSWLNKWRNPGPTQRDSCQRFHCFEAALC